MATEQLIIGTLNDTDITEYCLNDNLICEQFEKSNIKQACYELRASNIYYDLSENKKRYDLKEGDYILLKPKQFVVIITYEKLKLPLNILGRILTKGKLFSVGLLPVNTYADPGFIGKLGIVFFNASNNYLKIFPKDNIAKIEFSKLHQAVETPYHGQHGYDAEIWPIPETMVLQHDEYKNDARIKSSVEEISLAYGNDMTEVINRVFKYERRLILAAVAYGIITFALIVPLAKLNLLEVWATIFIGVISSIIAAIIFNFATKLRK